MAGSGTNTGEGNEWKNTRNREGADRLGNTKSGAALIRQMTDRCEQIVRLVRRAENTGGKLSRRHHMKHKYNET